MLLEIMQFHRDSSADVRKFVLGEILIPTLWSLFQYLDEVNLSECDELGPHGNIKNISTLLNSLIKVFIIQ